MHRPGSRGADDESSSRSRRRRRNSWRSGAAVAAALAVASGGLAACSSSGKAQLVWYINPDSGGQAQIAKDCSTDQYTITTQTLPQDAGQQRVQLARRLEAHDPGIDLMSIDPPYTAEFANAGLLAPIPKAEQEILTKQSFKGAVTAATWGGQLAVYPFWSNVQVLWYRKSFAQKAGIDMTQPVTWSQIITAAADNGGQIGVQANKYEGYVVWINALDAGAGGTLVSDAGAGIDAKVDLGDAAGQDAAKVIEDLAHSKAAPPDLSVSTEGTAASTFAGNTGSFMVNWTFIWHNYDSTDPKLQSDIGYTTYPETVQGKPARPPYGGIGIGVSKYSNHVDDATKAAACLVAPKQQATQAAITGNMPASEAGYQDPRIQKLFPADLIKLFEQSVEQAAPRTVTPYWSDISGGIQSTWHPPSAVTSSTPGKSASFISNVLHGKSLL